MMCRSVFANEAGREIETCSQGKGSRSIAKAKKNQAPRNSLHGRGEAGKNMEE